MSTDNITEVSSTLQSAAYYGRLLSQETQLNETITVTGPIVWNEKVT